MIVHFVSPWYPDPFSPYAGVFVKKQVDSLAAQGHTVTVENPEIYPAPPGSVPSEVWEAMRTLANRDIEALCVAFGESMKVPAPVPSGAGMLGRAEAFAQAIELKREFIPVGNPDVVHAHLGVPTGLACLKLGDSPLVVTEHQSTLSQVFGQPGGIDAYRRVVEESSAFLCVSEHLKAQIVAAIGNQYRSDLRVVPNIVDLESIEFRLRENQSVDHWIYVGTVFQHKGIELLFRSFKEFKKRSRQGVLTVVGDGPHMSWVRRFVAAHDLGASVNLVGSVPHHKVGNLLETADVFVHLSPAETFGIASLEAIGAGLPVVSLENGGANSAWGDFEFAVGRLLRIGSGPEEVVEAVTGLYSTDSLDPIHGREQVENRFAPMSVAEALGAIYEEVA